MRRIVKATKDHRREKKRISKFVIAITLSDNRKRLKKNDDHRRRKRKIIPARWYRAIIIIIIAEGVLIGGQALLQKRSKNALIVGTSAR